MVLHFKSLVAAVTLVFLYAGVILTIGTVSVPVNEVFSEKCKSNGENSCNEEKIRQKSWTSNLCDLGNESHDRSKRNTDNNTLACVNIVTNLENLAVMPDQFAEIR